MGEGVGSPSQPGIPLRAQRPASRCPSAACSSLGFCPETQLPPHCLFVRRGGLGPKRGRGKGRDEAQGGAEEGRGKAGCVSGEDGVGAIMSVQPRGCVFYLFI